MPDGQNITRREDMPMQTRFASFQPTTYNVDQRTVELVWSAGAEVRRRDWWNERNYIERLSMEDGAVNLARLNGGAPLLNSHQMRDLTAQIGVVEKAWLEKGEGRALVRFSSREAVAAILQDVKDGIIRNVSVGYEVYRYDIIERKGEDPIYTAVDWSPLEISLVTIPADPSASVRSAPDGKTRTCACEFINRAAAQTEESETMPKENTGGNPAETTAQVATQSSTTDTRALDQVRLEERTRCNDIRTAATALKIDETHVQRFIDEGTTADLARQRMIDLVAEQAKVNRIGSPAVQTDRPSGDDPAVKREAMAEAIFVRALHGRRKVEPSAQAREFMDMTFTDIAGELLRGAGVRNVNRMSRAQTIGMILSRAAPGNTTSDFTYIVLDAQNKILLNEYQVAEPTYKKIAAHHHFVDFKTHNLIRLGDFPDLLPVGEDGEIKSGSMKDSNETASLQSYGRKIKLSRKLLINDDMNAFLRLPQKIAQKAVGLENRTVMALLAQNSGAGPTMSDGYAMFSTQHANIAVSPSAIDVNNAALASAAIRKQKGLTDDKRTTGEPLNLQSRYLLVGPDRELQARQLLAVVMATKASDFNPYAGTMEPLVDANVVGNKWYEFADPDIAEALVYGFLDGAEGPQLAVNDFDIDGIVMKIIHDFAAGAADWKPAYYNAGA